MNFVAAMSNYELAS